MDDERLRWYEAVLTQMVDAVLKNQDPFEVLKIVLLLGYPEDDVVRLAQMFDCLVGRMLQILRSEVYDHGKQLVAGVEDYLREQGAKEDRS